MEKHCLVVAFALIAATLSAASIDYVLTNGLYPNHDAYGIKTALLTNAAISIILLIILLVVKQIFFKYKR